LKDPQFHSLGFFDTSHTVQNVAVPFFRVEHVSYGDNFMPHFKYEKAAETTTYDVTFNPLGIRAGVTSTVTVRTAAAKYKELTFKIAKCQDGE
jgi:hypothetical protein